MGNFKEHVLFGLLLAAAVSYFFKEQIILSNIQLIIAVILVVIGSVLPDIDHKKAYVHRAAKAFISIGGAALTMLLTPLPVYYRFSIAATVFLFLYALISAIKIKHRGFTHTITFALIVTALTSLATALIIQSAYTGLTISLGLASHLILDKEFKLS